MACIFSAQRKDFEADLRERIGNRVEAICEKVGVEVAYAFHDINDIPFSYTVPDNRTSVLGRVEGSVPAGRAKPWGTRQAVPAAKDLIHESFIVINANDYYGKEA